MQNLKRNFTLIGLIVLFGLSLSILPAQAADNDILVYVFPNNLGADMMDFTYFNEEIKEYLAENGYAVTSMGRGGANELTSALLSNYGQVWIIDTGDAQPPISSTEITNLVEYYETGGNILLAGEGPTISAQNDIDLIAQEFNTSFGNGPDGTNNGCSSVNQIANPYSAFILSGVSTISTSGNFSNAIITTTNTDVKPVAVSNTGVNMIYALGKCSPKGRIIFHTSWCTFIDADSGTTATIASCNSKQYTKNAANWLNQENSTICPVSTCALSASPNPINIGDSTTLTWTSTGADTVDSSNFGAVGVSGSATVSPTTSSTTYNLTVSGASGIGSCSAVVITTLPPISGGLIPCGRKTDNPDTPNVNETDECTVCHFFLMIKNIMDFITKIAVIVAILFISLGGIMYVLSTGNEAMLSKAKAMITYAIVGFILIFAAWIIIELILSTFGYTNPLGGEWDVIC